MELWCLSGDRGGSIVQEAMATHVSTRWIIKFTFHAVLPLVNLCLSKKLKRDQDLCSSSGSTTAVLKILNIL